MRNDRGVTPPDAAAAYRGLRIAHVNQIRAALEDHLPRLDWSRSKIEDVQTLRLRALLGIARRRSPFHAARLADVDPATATPADLSRIPPMVKAETQQHWDDIITVPGLDRADAETILATQQWYSYTPDGHQIFSSGGSTGVRGVYVWGWEQLVTLACLAWRWQVRAERAAGTFERPARMAVLAAGGPPHASTPLFDVATGPHMNTTVITAGAPFSEVQAAVAAVRPTHLVGYASVIGRLARACLAGDVDLQPVRVSTNSEPLTEEDRDAIRSAWGADIHNLWGSTEIGVQAVGCGRGEGLHICEDEVILERVDADGRPVGHGEPAVRTLATGLAGLSFPFLRYDLGDEVTLEPGRCQCGSAMLRVADIAGRRDDDFRYGETTVPASAFRHVLGTEPRISEYQVRQTPAGAKALIVGSADPDVVRDGLLNSLRRYGLAQPEIEVHQVDVIERHAATGKLKRFVPLG